MKRAAVVTLRYAFDHRADLLAALVYGCLAYLSFNALADYANGHNLFPAPRGGYAFAAAIDGSVLYAFISFKRAPWMAGALLVAGAVSTYMLQRWHAEQHQHPLIVAGVVPGLMVLVTLAWHMIRQTPTSERDRKRTPEVERQAPERVATTAAPVPAAKGSPRERLPEREGRPGGSTPAAAPARSGVAPPTPERVTKSTDRSGERTRLIREHLAADLNRSTRQIEEALKSTPGLVGDRSAFNKLVKQLRSEMKQESNGAPERVEVLS